MSDLISRNVLVERISKNSIFEKVTIGEKNIYQIIDELDVTDINVGNKWIPCSERLPKIEEEPSEYAKDVGRTFLVTYKDGFVCECVLWKNENKFDEDVIAWMEMPEPYKGE